MTANSRSSAVLHIKKYPNRRYYDAIHSRHVTLKEIHDAIVAGQDVCITDSRTGDDITNVVLTQILLEQDQPKLDIFPSAVLHLMIRSNRQLLRGWVERMFGPLMGLIATSQKQFDAYVREAMQGRMPMPFDWTRFVPGGGTPGPQPSSKAASEWGPADEVPPPAGAPQADEPVEELRRQVAALRRRIEELAQEKGGDAPREDPGL